MKIKVCDASIEVLNYLVAKIEALPKDHLRFSNGKTTIDRECLGRIDTFRCEFSTNWTQGGPIIERENIDLISPTPSDPLWQAMQWRFAHGAKGPTPLIAAMRCFVASKLGDAVNIPDELCE